MGKTFDQVIKMLPVFGPAQRAAIRKRIDELDQGVDAVDLQLYTEREIQTLRDRIAELEKPPSDVARIINGLSRRDQQLALKWRRVGLREGGASLPVHDAINDLYTIMSVCGYVAVPDVQPDILRIQLEGLDALLDQYMTQLTELYEADPGAAQYAADEPGLQMMLDQVHDIRGALQALFDDDGDGGKLHAALDKHMTDQNKKRHAAIAWQQEKRQREDAQRQAERERQAAAEAAEQARINTLTYAQRRNGLIKWGIVEMMAEKRESQLPAARQLHERLETVSRHADLSDEQKMIFDHLGTLLTGANPGPMIGKLMDDQVLAVKWKNGSIRL